MLDMLYIFKDGKVEKCNSLIEWGNQPFSDKVIDVTDVGEDVKVSTVFLGIDHNHSGEGPPILFETMVFGGTFDGFQWRYASLGEAKKGHWEIVDGVKDENLDTLHFGVVGMNLLLKEFLQHLSEEIESEDKFNQSDED